MSGRVGVVADVVAAGSAERRMGDVGFLGDHAEEAGEIRESAPHHRLPLVDIRQKPILGVRSLMIGGVREKLCRPVGEAGGSSDAQCRFVANVVKHGTLGQSRCLTHVVDAHRLIPLRTLRSL
jgi:hypothetical protein